VARVELKGIHKVRKQLSDGTVREYHYAWRGGPKFWATDSNFKKNSSEYVAALADVAERPKPRGLTVPVLVDFYLDSPEYGSKAARTQADYRKFALNLAKDFKDDSATIFEDPESRVEVNEWRKRWGHSPKQYDYAATVVSIILNWARDEGHIRLHHCDQLRKVYKSDRSEIVWTNEDILRFERVAPRWVQRILCVASETGLRPGDLIRLNWSHIENTREGRRVRIRTNKRGQVASIPVTPRLGVVLDETPTDRLLILVSHTGRSLTEHRASEAVRQWRDKAELSSSLRLQDARGTAATKLLRAGCNLHQIAQHMAWSLRHASNVIEKYATVSPEDSDEILVILDRAKKIESGTNV